MMHSVIGSLLSLIFVLLQVCPLCKTVIGRNRRYSYIIKPQYAAVCEVKEKEFGRMDSIDRSRNRLIEKLIEVPDKG
jgi:hypothetical protein